MNGIWKVGFVLLSGNFVDVFMIMLLVSVSISRLFVEWVYIVR